MASDDETNIDYKKVLADLRARRDRIDAAIAGIEAMLVRRDPGEGAADHRFDLGGRHVAPTQRLEGVILAVMGEYRGSPALVADANAGFHAAGFWNFSRCAYSPSTFFTIRACSGWFPSA